MSTQWLPAIRLATLQEHVLQQCQVSGSFLDAGCNCNWEVKIYGHLEFAHSQMVALHNYTGRYSNEAICYSCSIANMNVISVLSSYSMHTLWNSWRTTYMKVQLLWMLDQEVDTSLHAWHSWWVYVCNTVAEKCTILAPLRAYRFRLPASGFYGGREVHCSGSASR